MKGIFLLLLALTNVYGEMLLTDIKPGSKITITKKILFNPASSYPILTFQNRVIIANDSADTNSSYCDIIDPTLGTRSIQPKNYTIKTIEIESEFKRDYYVTFYFVNSDIELTCYSDLEGHDLTLSDFHKNYPASITLKPILFTRSVEAPLI